MCCKSRRANRYAYSVEPGMLAGGYNSTSYRGCGGRRQRHRGGPVSGLIALVKPIIQEQIEKRNQINNKDTFVAFEQQPRAQEQSSGIVQHAKIDTCEPAPVYEDEKATPLMSSNPRINEIPPSYEHAVQVRRVELPEIDTEEVFSKLSIQSDLPEAVRKEEHSTTRVIPDSPAESREVRPQRLSRCGERYAEKLLRKQEKAEAKFQRKMDKIAKKESKLQDRFK